MLRIVLELSKFELFKEEDKNNNQEKEKKIKDDKNFLVKVFVDYGVDIFFSLGLNGGQFSDMLMFGSDVREMDDVFIYDNCGSDDNQDTVFWYDNIGGLLENSIYFFMTEVYKFYYSKKYYKIGKDYLRIVIFFSFYGNYSKFGFFYIYIVYFYESDYENIGRRRVSYKFFMVDQVKYGFYNLYVSKNFKVEKVRGIYYKYQIRCEMVC